MHALIVVGGGFSQQIKKKNENVSSLLLPHFVILLSSEHINSVWIPPPNSNTWKAGDRPHVPASDGGLWYWMWCLCRRGYFELFFGLTLSSPCPWHCASAVFRQVSRTCTAFAQREKVGCEPGRPLQDIPVWSAWGGSSLEAEDQESDSLAVHATDRGKSSWSPRGHWTPAQLSTLM